MTEQEIRDQWKPSETEQEWMPMIQCQILQEMAAQLAKLNEKLESMSYENGGGINAFLCASNDVIPFRKVE